MDLNPETNPEVGLVKQHVNALAEHFDTVHIFVTRYDPTVEDGTVFINFGTGSWYARFGQVHEWMIKEEEIARAAVHVK